jgi:DnaA N-terminal domain
MWDAPARDQDTLPGNTRRSQPPRLAREDGRRGSASALEYPVEGQVEIAGWQGVEAQGPYGSGHGQTGATGEQDEVTHPESTRAGGETEETTDTDTDTWDMRQDEIPSTAGDASLVPSDRLCSVWRAALQRLRRQLPQAEFDSWLSGTHLAQNRAGQLTVCARTAYAQEMLRMRYLERIEQAIRDVGGAWEMATVSITAGPACLLNTGVAADRSVVARAG